MALTPRFKLGPDMMGWMGRVRMYRVASDAVGCRWRMSILDNGLRATWDNGMKRTKCWGFLRAGNIGEATKRLGRLWTRCGGWAEGRFLLAVSIPASFSDSSPLGL